MPPSLRVRPATLRDARPLWRWRNDPVTRAASFRTTVIPYPRHRRWLGRALDDGRMRLYIGEAGSGRPVGYVRYRREVDGIAEVSVVVAPEARGRGFAGALLRATCPVAARDLGLARIVALVRPDNRASLRAFRSAGFRRRRPSQRAEPEPAVLVWRPRRQARKRAPRGDRP